MTRVFIDGSAGTTGLRIKERLLERRDIELIILPEEMRKDENARKDALNSADIAFLCLPDDAAMQSVELTYSPDTVIIDTSTAHRTNDGWTYGFPELGNLREQIRKSKRIANPGCHASGFISLVRPLTEKRIISGNEYLSCFSLTGYSGGGKKMIADYESKERSSLLSAPRIYGLGQSHKHIPEMVKICGLSKSPAFCPTVADFYSGMLVTVVLDGSAVKGGIEAVKNTYSEYYTEGLVKYVPNADENGFLSAVAISGRDDMEISVFGNDERIMLASRFDNLGKGASGSALQNMNTVLGIDEKTGLCVG